MSAQVGGGGREQGPNTHICLPGATMQCFSFIKTMMILFNMLIFVSVGVMGSLGFPIGVGLNLSRARTGEEETAMPRLFLQVEEVQKSPQMLSPGPSSSLAATQLGWRRLGASSPFQEASAQAGLQQGRVG